MKKLLFSLALMLFAGMSFAQIKVINNGNTGIGAAFTTGGQNPQQQLDVDGNTNSRGNVFSMGQDAGTGNATVYIGLNRAANGPATIRFASDVSAYPLGGTTFGRGPTGAGGLFHDGTSTLGIIANDNADVSLGTNQTVRMIIKKSTGQIGIGTLSPAYKLHVVGNAGKTSGGSDWVVISDKRLKKDIREYEAGLDEIMKIRPVVFKYTGKAGTDASNEDHVGVIAQELEKVAPYTVKPYVYNEVVEEKDANDPFARNQTVVSTEEYKSVDASAVRWMLVNSVQELKAEIDAKDAELAEVKAELAEIKQMLLNSGGSVSQQVDLTDAKLEQNAPNPFSETTVVRYAVPAKAQSAVVQIFDLNGRLIKDVNVAKGNGQLTINAKELGAGTYIYKLVVDGSVVDTKKMVLTK